MNIGAPSVAVRESRDPRNLWMDTPGDGVARLDGASYVMIEGPL